MEGYCNFQRPTLANLDDQMRATGMILGQVLAKRPAWDRMPGVTCLFYPFLHNISDANTCFSLLQFIPEKRKIFDQKTCKPENRVCCSSICQKLDFPAKRHLCLFLKISGCIGGFTNLPMSIKLQKTARYKLEINPSQPDKEDQNGKKRSKKNVEKHRNVVGSPGDSMYGLYGTCPGSP